MIEQSLSAARMPEFLTVGQAAKELGVSPWTLRNWDRTGKLKPTRHPKNGYRIYRHEDLQAIIGLTAPTGNPRADWSHIADSDHFVQFYESDEFLASSVAGFIGSALEAGDCGIIITTREHRMHIHKALKQRGLDVPTLRAGRRFVALDAAETLSKFMVDGMPKP